MKMNLSLKSRLHPNASSLRPNASNLHHRASTVSSSALRAWSSKPRYSNSLSTPKFKKKKKNKYKYRGIVVKKLPIIQIPGYSKSVFNEVRPTVKKNIKSDCINSLHSIRNYLSGVTGVFSKSHYSAILKPKSSTHSLVAGIGRDRGRSILTKLANQFNRRGNQRTVIKHVNAAFCLVHAAIKMDRSIDKFISVAKSFNQLWYLNPSFNRAPFPFIAKILDFTNYATPKFCIKRHINKGHGRRKKSKKGAPKLRSYLAFLSPHGRRVMSFKWLMLDYYKLAKGHKFKRNLCTFIINSIMGLEDNAPVDRKIELYREVVAYLRRRN